MPRPMGDRGEDERQASQKEAKCTMLYHDPPAQYLLSIYLVHLSRRSVFFASSVALTHNRPRPTATQNEYHGNFYTDTLRDLYHVRAVGGGLSVP